MSTSNATAMSIPNNVTSLSYAHTCHSALLNILYEACKRSVARGLLPHADAQELLTLAASRDSGIVRLAVEAVLARLESSRAVN